MSIDAKILNKTMTNRIQQYIGRTIYYKQIVLVPEMQDWFNILKQIKLHNIQINRLLGKKSHKYIRNFLAK